MRVSRPISRPLSHPLTHSLGRLGVDLDPLQALITSLFSSNEQGAIYIPKPIVKGAQALFQDAAGTVPVTSDGDPVGRMLDQSGNGYHAIQTVSAERIGYSEPNGLLQDQVDDSIIISGLSLTPATGTKTWTLCVGYSDLGTESIILLSNGVNSAQWVGIGDSGSTSTRLSDGAAQGSVWFNGVLESPAARGDMWTLLAASGVVVIEFQVNDTTDWNAPVIGKYGAGDFYGLKTSEFYLLREGALTESERKDVEAYAAERAGITL